MTPEQRERVSQLFGEVLERDPSQREAFLNQCCDDEEILAEVKSLLSEDERVGDFIDKPLEGPISPSSQDRSNQPVLSEDILLKIGERYEGLAEIGQGGMGIVYKARDRITGELVALKVLRPDFAADRTASQRFKNELLLAHKITHKNVCRIHEFNPIDGSAYISMEFVEGENLCSVLARFGGFRLHKGIQIACQICAGLREAHSHGIVHRDLKPANIMIDVEGNAKIMDFGIARSVDAGITQGAAIIGTPAYMAPEQSQGKKVDARTDIYALGLILYEMFTGKPAFCGENPVPAAHKQVSGRPQHPCELEPCIPSGIDKAIMRCLESDPADRFQSVDELETALESCQEVVGALISSAFPESFPLVKLRLWIVRASILLPLLAAFFVAGYLLGQKWNAAAGGMHHEDAINSLAFSPDGRLLASGSEDKTISLWDVSKQRKVRTLADHGRAVTSVAFSSDGRWLASGSADKSIKIWEVATGRLLRTLMDAKAVEVVALSPDGTWLASGLGDGTVTIWHVEEGRAAHVLHHTDGVQALAFSANGHWLATGSIDETVRIWEVETGQPDGDPLHHDDQVQAIAFSPDGHLLVSGSSDKTIRIWALTTRLTVQILHHEDWIVALAFTSDGNVLASASEDGQVKLWESPTWRQIAPLTKEVKSAQAWAFSPDGHHLAVGTAAGVVEIRPLKK